MSQYEFFMMIASVVVAVGLTEVIGGWGKILRDSTVTVEADWLHIGTCINIVLGSIQYWLGMWAYNSIEFETNLQILFLVVPSAFLVLAAFVITPETNQNKTLNCRNYYMSRRRPYFIAVALCGWSAGLADYVIVGSEVVDTSFILVFVVLPCVQFYLAWTARIWVHSTILIFSALSLIAFYGQEFALIDNRFL